MTINIAIIGLGRIGSILLQQMQLSKERGINILAVAELNETPGKIFAQANDIPINTMEGIAGLNEEVDIIFELTGNMDVRRELRNMLAVSKNRHTVIATETLAIMICSLLTDKELPDVHSHTGY